VVSPTADSPTERSKRRKRSTGPRTRRLNSPEEGSAGRVLKDPEEGAEISQQESASEGTQSGPTPAPSTGSPSNSELRSWARENGVAVSDRGRVPASVLTAYRNAHNE
jgi:hypothetical protein